MKKTLLILALATALPLITQASAFLGGDLLAVRVGDGVNALLNSTGQVAVLEVSTAGSLVQPAIVVPSGSGGLQISGTGTSEGQLVRNADGSSWTIAGYVPPYTGSGSLSSRTAAQAPRGYVTIDSSATLSSVTTLPSSPYSAQNIRSGLTSGSTAWFAGSGTAAGQGVVYYNGTSSSSIQGVNSRVLNLYNGDLFYSTGSGVQGLYKYSGTPTSATTSTAFLTGVTGQGTSPYDFVFSPTGNTLYVADDALGVQKFTFNGSVWSFAYTFTNTVSSSKAFGLAVDFSGANPTLYWTSPTDLWKVTDTGSAAAVGASSILSAGANYAFRGLDMTAVPEPPPFALLGLGVLAIACARRIWSRR